MRYPAISPMPRPLGLFCLALCIFLSQANVFAAPATEAVVTDADRARIEAALPAEAPVKPLKPRRLLIFDVNVVYGGHPSRFYANYAFQKMGEKTGAFETVISRDPAVFKKESLRQFDAVFLNNTVGNLFTDPQLRKNLVEFVYNGGGLMGDHGTTVAFLRWNEGAADDWPEFGHMIGARGANHRAPDEHVYIKLDDPTHPLNAPFGGKGFEYRSEFFRVGAPYSRDSLRVLLGIDTEKTDLNADPKRKPERADGDYALAWVKHYGKGRVFYCTIGHNPYIFWDTKMLEFYLGATQFALGDLPASTIPSARLTPAIRAQEKIGWKLGVTAYTFHRYTLFETIEKTAQLGLAYLGGLDFQKVSKDINKNFNANLSDEELAAIRMKLDTHGVRLVTCFYSVIPSDEAGCRKVFEFARKMGIENLISEPPLESLDMIEGFCDEYGINLAIHNHDRKASPNYYSPEKILEVCRGRGPRIGACVDMGYWMRGGIDPIAGIVKLGDRALVIQTHDLDVQGPEGHDVPWGTGAARMETLLRTMHREGIKPAMFGLEYSYDWLDSMPECEASARFFDRVTLDLAK